MKKRLFISSILMTLVLLVAITTATFAWYQATNAGTLSQGNTNQSSLSTAGVTINLNANAQINIQPEASSQSLVITDRSGLSYYFAGNNQRLLSTDHEGAALSDRQKSNHFNVTITDGSGNALASEDILATLAGTYIIKVTAGGQAKISLDQTTVLGTDSTSTGTQMQYDSGEEANGALGVALQNATDVMKIVIDAAGSVTYYVPELVDDDEDNSTPMVWAWNSGTAWSFSTLLSAPKATATYYVGLQVDDLTKADDLNAAGTVTPAMVAEANSVGFH